ncbi:MAG: hypothetical protein OQL09_03575 [Gammaproteobacteria bacterium]|nr:hypothetical protein [Gammaproteobacteria bacterium]
MSEEKSIKSETGTIEASDDARAHEFLQQQLAKAEQHLAALPADAKAVDRANILLEQSNALLGLNRHEEAWNAGKQAFEIFVENESWPAAVEACDILYQTEQPASIVALAHGVWLAVTYPIDPEQTIVMMNYIVEETPDSSDGAAVAAATAHYIVGLRCDDEKYNSLSFLTTNLIAKVAQRHGNVKSQEALDFWMEKLELKDPAIFLPRMGMVLNAIVEEGNWWFDRDKLREKLPVN